MCANKKCLHWGAGGCKLFNGESWRRCRHAEEAKTKNHTSNSNKHKEK